MDCVNAYVRVHEYVKGCSGMWWMSLPYDCLMKCDLWRYLYVRVAHSCCTWPVDSFVIGCGKNFHSWLSNCVSWSAPYTSSRIHSSTTLIISKSLSFNPSLSCRYWHHYCCWCMNFVSCDAAVKNCTIPICVTNTVPTAVRSANDAMCYSAH